VQFYKTFAHLIYLEYWLLKCYLKMLVFCFLNIYGLFLIAIILDNQTYFLNTNTFQDT